MVDQPTHYELMVQIARIQETIVTLRSDLLDMKAEYRDVRQKVEGLAGDAARGKAMLSVLLVVGGAVGAVIAMVLNAANLFAGKAP